MEVCIARRLLKGEKVEVICREYELSRGKVISILNRYCKEVDFHSYLKAQSEATHQGLLAIKYLLKYRQAFLNSKRVEKITSTTHIDYIPDLSTKEKKILKQEGLMRLSDIDAEFICSLQWKIKNPTHSILLGLGAVGCQRVINVYRKYNSKSQKELNCEN